MTIFENKMQKSYYSFVNFRPFNLIFVESEQSSLFYKIARDDSMLGTESKDKFDLVNRVRRRAKLKKTTKREW